MNRKKNTGLKIRGYKNSQPNFKDENAEEGNDEEGQLEHLSSMRDYL